MGLISPNSSLQGNSQGDRDLKEQATSPHSQERQNESMHSYYSAYGRHCSTAQNPNPGNSTAHFQAGLSTLIKAIKIISPRHPHRPIYLEDSSLKFPGDSNCSNLTTLPIILNNTQILNEVRMLFVI